jgi:thiosulfate/3-mercaptopyruvate sulfurtransferase
MKVFLIFIAMMSSVYAMEPLINAQWLNEHLGDPLLSIIEVSDGDSYELEHIPGAQHTGINAWRFDNGTFFSIRSVDEIEKEISRLGINLNSNVVLYAPINNPKDLLKVSYVYWALHYHGVKNVALLDGGIGTWKSAKLPMNNVIPAINSTSFKAHIDASKIADLKYVKEHLEKLPMIDARPSDMYLGVTATPTVKRNGHIKGGMSYSWNYSVDNNYIVKPKVMLESVFKEGYKLNKDKEILLYCTGGLETSFNYFVLTGILGYKNVRLYDASMKEWGNREDTSMVQYRYEMFYK